MKILINILTVCSLFNILSCKTLNKNSTVKSTTGQPEQIMSVVTCSHPSPVDATDSLVLSIIKEEAEIKIESELADLNSLTVKEHRSKDVLTYNTNGVSLKIDMKKSLGIRVFESDLKYTYKGKQMAATARCRVFERFKAEEIIRDKFICEATESQNSQLALRIQSTDDKSIMTIASSRKALDLEPIFRQKAIKNTLLDSKISYKLADDSAEFILDLTSRKDRNLFDGSASYKTEAKEYDDNEVPKSHVKINKEDLVCYLPNFIEASDLAARVKMTGRVAGVDNDAYAQLKKSMAEFKKTGALSKVNFIIDGDEGGGVYCVESKTNKQLREVIAKLKEIKFDASSTEYFIDAQPVCK